MKKSNKETGISVIMPTYKQQAFLPRAIASLVNQTFTSWELIIVNDGSPDNTKEIVKPYLNNEKIKYFENEENKGLGAAINKGINFAKYDYIAYLPSDDIYFKDHLQTLYDALHGNKVAVLCYSGLRYKYFVAITTDGYLTSKGLVPNKCLQLVQVLHRKTNDKWVERAEFESDDLFQLFWCKLSAKGLFVSTGNITCEWISHPQQRSKIIGGFWGRKFRNYYSINKPFVLYSEKKIVVNDNTIYGNISLKISETPKKLKILLVGELSHNGERIHALEEAGHELYALWEIEPIYGTVGPFPIGNIKTISQYNWQESIKMIKPDIIYAQLNYMSAKLALKVLKRNPEIPFVWHHKESAFDVRQNGNWDTLYQLYSQADGQIYISEENRDWFEQFLPKTNRFSMILDGDMPKSNWFTNEQTPLLSATDGEFHTVVPGRPYGIEPEDIEILAKQKIHFHFYGEWFQGIWREWLNKTEKLVKAYIHAHPMCYPHNWVKELSKYDAGWLHYNKSENYGELLKCTWADLNIPSRMTTLIAAGLPLLQYDNTGHIVATQNITKKHDIGLFFKNLEELSTIFKNKELMTHLRENVWKQRMQFSFDYHVPDLIAFFEKVIERKKIMNK